MKNFAVLLVLFLALSSIAFAQAPSAPVAPAGFADRYAFAGGGITSASGPSQGYGVVAYAHKTGLFNGTTNFPTYAYTACRFYSFPKVFGKVTSDKQAVDCTEGLLFPFLDRDVLNGHAHVRLYVEGDAGFSQGGGNVGYTVGAKTGIDISRKATSRFGLDVISDASRSSVTGVHSTMVTIGLRGSF
ncbi:MAG TPA: hypothetical protein VNH83_12660 [Bryobacteraceae bacterium]|nr:hypothetical protein [Bryobacteraceae bacterium]